MSDVIARLLRRSPADWWTAVKFRTRAGFSRLTKPGPQPRVLSTRFLKRRNYVTRAMIGRVLAGEPLADVLSGFDALAFDERVLEYTVLVSWLIKRANGDDLLDVGCVVNNPLVSSVLKSRCRNVWLSNPAVEPVVLDGPVFYHVADLEHAFPRGPKFPLVTCLSTLEHIGFDNSHYGVATPPRYSAPCNDPLQESLERLSELLAPRGALLVSIPFGYREALVHPRTGRVSSQVFDNESLEAGRAVLLSRGVHPEWTVWEATPGGWQNADPERCHARYAQGCPAAAAVAILQATRSE